MQFPVHIGLHRSFLLCYSLLLLSLPVLMLVLLAPHPWFWRLLYACLWLLLLITAWCAWSKQPQSLILQADGLIRLADEECGRKVLDGACVHPWLTVFRLENGKKRPLTVVVTVDSLNPEDFRRLRVFLRWRRPLSRGGVV
ncbi:protein YgfX [Dechloromonas sp. ZY10]|uniref:protein YgfX n=1 Tax=Dechloromonas aquae TaxID=2664436 RepID=UPI003526C8E3